MEQGHHLHPQRAQRPALDRALRRGADPQHAGRLLPLQDHLLQGAPRPPLGHAPFLGHTPDVLWLRPHGAGSRCITIVWPRPPTGPRPFADLLSQSLALVCLAPFPRVPHPFGMAPPPESPPFMNDPSLSYWRRSFLVTPPFLNGPFGTAVPLTLPRNPTPPGPILSHCPPRLPFLPRHDIGARVPTKCRARC